MEMIPFSIQSEMGVEALEGIAGIEKVNDFGKLQEIQFSIRSRSTEDPCRTIIKNPNLPGSKSPNLHLMIFLSESLPRKKRRKPWIKY